jgi:hypothetical protein
MKRSDRALSETFSVILMAMLVIIAALLLVASLTGVITNLLQKPAFLSVQAVQYNTSANTHIIGLYHQQGDPVNLNGTTQAEGISIVSFVIIEPGGSQYPVDAATTIMVHDSWESGNLLYVYQSGGSYVFTDVMPAGATTLPPGTYIIKITDNKAKVLLHALPVTIR